MCAPMANILTRDGREGGSAECRMQNANESCQSGRSGKEEEEEEEEMTMMISSATTTTTKSVK